MGGITNNFKKPGDFLINNKINNGQIQFSSNQSENGVLINSVTFEIEEEDERIVLFIDTRDFDMQYPHLIREIPQSVIPAKKAYEIINSNTSL